MMYPMCRLKQKHCWCRLFTARQSNESYPEPGNEDSHLYLERLCDAMQPAQNNLSKRGEPAWAWKETSRRVQHAFQLLFPHSNPSVFPVLNFQSVHVLLIQWDQAHAKLELAQVGLNNNSLCVQCHGFTQ